MRHLDQRCTGKQFALTILRRPLAEPRPGVGQTADTRRPSASPPRPDMMVVLYSICCGVSQAWS